ncbi:MAG TPA: hypothetical protein VGJ32_00715, partial [Solirubrobacteraceae bacterium]
RSFDVNGRALQGLTAGATEAFSLPRVHPTLRDVDTYLGWFGPATRAVATFSLAARLPGARAALGALAERFVKGSSGGPDAAARARSRSHVVAIACNSAKAPLATVHIEGANGYDFTADMLAWGAERARDGTLHGAGALGPVEAFGLDALREGCAEAGLTRV